MTLAHNIFYRAYTLVESAVDYESAVEDLISLARGNRRTLEEARGLMEELSVVGDPAERLDVAAVVGFDDGVADFEAYQRSAVRTLLDRAVEAA